MSGIMLSVIGRSYIVPPPVIGSAYQGGYMGGQISYASAFTAGNGVAQYNLIVSPAATGFTSTVWKTSSTASTSPDGTDGWANSVALNTAGHSAVNFCRALTIGGYTDWYLPSMNEMEILYWNLKPDTAAHSGNGWPGNEYAIPSRYGLSNYSTHPGQTPVAIFQAGGAQAITGNYWTSSNWGNEWGRYLDIGSGGFAWGMLKYYNNGVRAIRRVGVGTV